MFIIVILLVFDGVLRCMNVIIIFMRVGLFSICEKFMFFIFIGFMLNLVCKMKILK